METEEAPAKKMNGIETPQRRVKCQYWRKCFRKDKRHKKLYIHPGDPDEKQAATAKASKEVKGLSSFYLNFSILLILNNSTRAMHVK